MPSSSSALATQRRIRAQAPVFAALGDETRLSLLAKLCASPSCSLAQLTCGTAVSRQAIAKHLGILEAVGIVRSARHGRENRFTVEPRTLVQAKEYLDLVSSQWDDALARLKAFVED